MESVKTAPCNLSRRLFGLVGALLLSTAAQAQNATNVDPSLDAFVKSYKARGVMEDGSKPLAPEEALTHFKMAPGLKIETVAHEPVISQPINIHFDERGRMWVVQYLQFPFPAGLKVLHFDEYLRAVYDKVPEPPPHGVKGLDRITILEDKDGDGVFDSHKDFVSGLNMATSVLTGHGGVWVMNPPYLLFYPDKDHDDVPDGDPEVRLSGFGLEDTHAIANGLTWGPDGWLYGATGSTVTATVNGLHWLGQAIWRYHPDTREFELFAEGGGNTWAMEFDSQGRLFSGTNYSDVRGLHFVQGGYYLKTVAKHGPLTNPYAFGFFGHMTHHQTTPLTHVCQPFVLYEGGAFPERFNGQVFTGIALSNRVQASKRIPVGTTFDTEDTEPLVTSDDPWFRPVSLTAGPDGAVYCSDWYDSRLTNLDPRDTWDHERGRVYRIEAENASPAKPFDLAQLSGEELVEQLKSPNKWFRQMALRVLYDRHDGSLVPGLRQEVLDNTGTFALSCLWALNASGGFDAGTATRMLSHDDPFVRAWTVRLLGDHPSDLISPEGASHLVELARKEPEALVRSQLASTCKRLAPNDAMPILNALLRHNEDVADKHIPLLEWWAMEKMAADPCIAMALLKDRELWRTPMFRQHLLARLARTYTAGREASKLMAVASMLTQAPEPELVDQVVKGMEEGLQGNAITEVPESLLESLAVVWKSRTHTPTLVSVALRLHHPEATAAAVAALGDAKTSAIERKGLLDTLSERHVEAALPGMIALLKAEKTEAAKLDLINALSRFNTAEAGRAILDSLPACTPRARTAAITALSSRAEWARALLERVDRGEVKKEHVAAGDLLTMQKLGDAPTDTLIKKHWGALRASPKEKEDLIKSLRLILARRGDAEKGHVLFKAICAVCHTLKGEGAKIGPELTGYERDNLDFMLPAIVDPSLGIREEYTLYTLATRDGQVRSGFVTESTPQLVTMMDAQGNKTKVAREDVKSLVASPVSLMPEGLLNALTPEQTRDLFAYLMAK